MKIPRGPKNFLKKCHFLVKIFFKNTIFFFKNTIFFFKNTIFFLQKFHGGRGNFKPPPPKLMYVWNDSVILSISDCKVLVQDPTTSCEDFPAISPPGTCQRHSSSHRRKSKLKRFAFYKGKCLAYYRDGCETSRNAWKTEKDCYKSKSFFKG